VRTIHTRWMIIRITDLYNFSFQTIHGMTAVQNSLGSLNTVPDLIFRNIFRIATEDYRTMIIAVRWMVGWFSFLTWKIGFYEQCRSARQMSSCHI
jgi:hypothetical protein